MGVGEAQRIHHRQDQLLPVRIQLPVAVEQGILFIVDYILLFFIEKIIGRDPEVICDPFESVEGRFGAIDFPTTYRLL